ncbi:MAG: hypothetical protein WBV90_07905, partial [Terrimicrobiaceae bacterium]
MREGTHVRAHRSVLGFSKMTPMHNNLKTTVKMEPQRLQFASVVRYILLGLMAGILIALIVAPKPWEHPHPAKLEDYVLIYSWWAGL